MNITINLFWIVVVCAVGIVIFLLHNGITLLKSLNIFSKHDNSVIEKFLNKYPDVAPAFMTKGIKEQNIENNQEIHEINKRLAEIEKRLQNGK